MTLYGDPERYKQTYWERFPGSYYTGDYAVKDEEGYFWLLGRADEVIKVAGHRLSTLELENAVISHPAVAECGAASKPDAIKGEAIVLFVILKDGYEPSDDLIKDIKRFARKKLHALACPRKLEFLPGLPKTKSGKIMRRLLKARELGFPGGLAHHQIFVPCFKTLRLLL